MLLGSHLLDFAIGLILVYFLLSLFCSWVNERIASWTNLRAKTLADGIEGLLGDALSRRLYDHPLIKGLGNQHGKNGNDFRRLLTKLLCFVLPARLKPRWQDPVTDRRPSYIDARTFALTLLNEVVMQGATLPVTSTWERRVDLVALRSAVDKMEPDGVRLALLPLIDAAQGDFDKTQKNIENWFNDAMQRLSGAYKRRTQWILLLIGLIVTIFLNADSGRIAQHLWQNDARQQIVVAAAEGEIERGFAEASPTPEREALERLVALELPLGYKTRSTATGETLGWFSTGWFQENLGGNGWEFAYRIGGWLVTAAAIALGAPFWFDVLNKLVNLRQTGKPPANEQ